MVQGTGISIGLNALPNPLGFGAVPIGGSGSTQMLTLANNITQAANVQSIALTGTNASDFQLGNVPALPAPVGAMSSIQIAVTFTPSDHGTRTAQLTVTSDAPNSPQMVTLTGSGAGPHLTASPSPLSLGSSNVGVNALALLNLGNTGELPLHVTSAAFSGTNGSEFSTPSVFPVVVAPAGSSSIVVQFRPAAAGPRTGQITLQSDDPITPAITVALDGTGTAPMISVMPGSVGFGLVTVGAVSMPTTITVANTGGGALSISAITLGGPDAAEFQLVAPALPLVIQPAASRTVAVSFAPQKVGMAMAKLTLVNDDPSSPSVDVPLSGTGAAPTIGVAPTMLDFGTQIVNVPSAKQSVDVSNTGSAPLTISSLDLLGTQASAFSLVNPPALPAMVASGSKLTLSLQHTPKVVGADSAHLDIGSDDPATPTASVKLSGLGIATAISVSPMSIDFGSLRAPGMATPQTVTITNISNAPFNLVAAMLGGTTPAPFSVSDPSGTVGPGATQTVTLGFQPTTPGTYSATATFATDDATIPPAVVALTGQGTAPRLQAMPATIDFGRIAIGSSSVARNVVLTNSSADPLQLKSVTSDAAVYATSGVNTTALVAAGAHTTFGITFTPTKEGTATATITVMIVGGTAAEATVNVTGVGVTATSMPDMGMGPIGKPPGGCSVAAGGRASASGVLLATLAFAALAVTRRRRRAPR
jgi:MYXO-CTERM domain-containing protein